MDMLTTIETARRQPNALRTRPAADTIVPAKRKRTRQLAVGGIAIALVAAIGWTTMMRPPAAAAVPPMATLGVAAPLVAPVVQWDDFVGRFAPSQMVEVRPRVAGQVTALYFHDGDLVHKGQLLFTIDERPYRAALAEAQANVAAARSALVLARSDYTRASRLSGDEAVSAGEVDGLRARLQAAQANLAAAEARARQRALDMEFTQVRAPIAGRVSDRRVDVGNLVAAGEGSNATLLTTINALDPIYFEFDSSEALFLKAKRDEAAHGTAPQVEIRLQDEPGYAWQGRLDFTDNGLDPHSGTIRGRAVIANPKLFLTPGLYGNMRMSGGGTVKALLVPDEAIQSDQARKTVLVVGADGTVGAKPVELGPLVRGLRVIRSGLQPTDRVVVTNLQAAMPGARAQTRTAPITPQADVRAPVTGAPAAAQATFAR
ncbi:efflux RND transporter periplasmic adaptor subunit [Novosphingobium sp.]|uniref:efflux RND transporter periplasmic adaptor subunit n=1 Tax=Novosphingobium sp. TaxID=1874826 RepID=UPI0038B741B1